MAGDGAVAAGGLPGPLFQSTPTNFMAGDLPPRFWRFSMAVFQSTPTNFMAGDGRVGATRHAHFGFNPRPPISWRATRWLLLIVGRRDVSIHAHQFHGGRHCVMGFIPAGMSFQSTPTNFMAGDGWRWRRRSGWRGFNPRPPISWRATSHQSGMCWCPACFNPRPPISWRATRCSGVVEDHHARFQSTPTNFMAGDPAVCCSSARLLSPFQSTPTNFMAGDQLQDHRLVLAQHVSIHAHQFHGGRRRVGQRWRR